MSSCGGLTPWRFNNLFPTLNNVSSSLRNLKISDGLNIIFPQVKMINSSITLQCNEFIQLTTGTVLKYTSLQPTQNKLEEADVQDLLDVFSDIRAGRKHNVEKGMRKERIENNKINLTRHPPHHEGWWIQYERKEKHSIYIGKRGVIHKDRVVVMALNWPNSYKGRGWSE